MKINDMKYVRVDIGKAIKFVAKTAEQMQNARSGREMAEIRNKYIAKEKHIQTMCSLGNIRFTLNTADEFYGKEKAYYDRNLPRLSAAALEFNKAFLNNPHLNEALALINPNVAKNYELSLKTVDEKIVPEMAEESMIMTEYSQLMSEMTFEYNGERLPFAVIRKYFDDADRNVRREAMATAGRTMQRFSGDLDALFERLVHVRHRMAQKMGFKSYAEMGDCRMGRYSYGRKEIKSFRSEVKNRAVPIVEKLRRKRAAELGLDRIMLYDYETYFFAGNPEPVLQDEEMFAAAQKMYHAMGAEAAEFIDMMLAADAFDVFPRQGKWGGGYCTSLDDYGQPFILANFNGSAGDVDVLTHEAGHALAFFEQFRHNIDYELGTGTMSIAEIHSMAMEFFAWPHMKDFFGAQADDYRYYHLLSSMTFLPYGCQVDEFEETCYNNPDMTPAERNELWKKLDIYYRPYLESDGIEYFEKGTRWQYQMHIYENPMYYIDYCLAQTTAHRFLLLAQDDYKQAFAKYLTLVKKGGSLPFGELLESVGLQNPLNAGVTADTTAKTAELAEKLAKQCTKKKTTG